MEQSSPGRLQGHSIRGDTAVSYSIEDGKHCITIMKFSLDNGAEDIEARVLRSETFDTEFQAGYEFRRWEELSGPLPKEQPAEDPVEREIQKREWDEAYAELCRFQFTEEMKEEARRLAAGETDYPPEESVLYEILTEIGVLPPPGKDSGSNPQQS